MRKQRFVQISKAQAHLLAIFGENLERENVIWSAEDKHNWYFILEYGR